MQPELPLKRRLGARIAARRKALGWTQSDLAEHVGVDTETISRFERGAALPSLVTLEKLSDELRSGLGELLAETSRHPDDQAAMLSAWLAKLKEADRGFVMAQIKQTCDYLSKQTG
ncbi:MAG: helix-turn-helix domain-containing protein [Candidatus Accumulibacter sp.]|jgi:transcriptional regulator with XRE-family HTH domain|nr:helix-turn-helix domain-containing protein [Accumulibacter sp.]